MNVIGAIRDFVNCFFLFPSFFIYVGSGQIDLDNADGG